MNFVVLPNGKSPPDRDQSTFFLLTDNWDDWFRFSTLYYLIFLDNTGVKHEIGNVKIGQFGMRADQRRPDLPENFEHLDENFFSLGQDESYYENLNNLDEGLRDIVLTALNDLAKNRILFERALKEDVTGVSLLRSVTRSTVRGQYQRLISGGARLSQYQFTYIGPRQLDRTLDPIKMEFSVQPESEPPTNVHVLIGRNGVGKTHLLNTMTRAFVQPNSNKDEVGKFENEDIFNNDFFANVVSVSFSAFDIFEPLPESQNKSTGVRYSYVGLKKKSDNPAERPSKPKSPTFFGKEFASSVKVCSQGTRALRWQNALKALETDPIFQEAGVSHLAQKTDDEEFKKHASRLFKKLSSGHKIVLLTITRLIELVEERTLVVLDEPEAHLHPPLLSAFIRSLSDLLIDRNGVAIIATHSPVVLQEVPKSCVWKVRRTGSQTSVERPEIETFGENVGVLTREIFGLEVTYSGFHKLLQDRIQQFDTYDAVIDHFGGELGGEAKAIIQALILEKRQRGLR